MAPTLQHNTYKDHAASTKENVADIKEEKLKEEEEEEEEEEELFEIDLGAVGDVAPPYYWESCLNATTCNYTLFANRLVPIADVSSAIPMANPKQTWLGSGSGSGKVIWVREAQPLQNFVGISYLDALSNLLQKKLINVSPSLNLEK